MTQPTRVRVGPVYYRVEWRDQAWSELCGKQGRCIPRESLIEISADIPADRIACTFAHEVYHALEWHYKRWDDADSEAAAIITGEGMVMVWRDNPDVFAWWSGLVRGDDVDGNQAHALADTIPAGSDNS